MRFDSDWTNTWTAASMRNTKCLVEIQVTNIRTEVRRPAQTDQGVQIRSVHIDLTAIPMDYLTQADNALFKDAVSRRIGHHQCTKLRLMKRCLLFKVR